MYIMYMLIPTRITHIYMYMCINRCMHIFLCTYIYMYIYVHTNKQHNQTIFLALSFTHVLSLFRALNPHPLSPPSCHTQEMTQLHTHTEARAPMQAPTPTPTPTPTPANSLSQQSKSEQEQVRARNTFCTPQVSWRLLGQQGGGGARIK